MTKNITVLLCNSAMSQAANVTCSTSPCFGVILYAAFLTISKYTAVNIYWF